jgi:hypothetical protein
VLAQISRVIEAIGRQIRAGVWDFRQRDLRQRGLGQDLGGDIVDGAIGDLVNEADILVFAGGQREITSRRVTSGSTMASRRAGHNRSSRRNTA